MTDMTVANIPASERNKLPRKFFTLLLVDQVDADVEHEHTVRCIWADLLRAETVAPQYAIGDASQAPLHFTTLCAWAASARAGVHTLDFPSFQAALIDLTEHGDTSVDPTATGRTA